MLVEDLSGRENVLWNKQKIGIVGNTTDGKLAFLEASKKHSQSAVTKNIGTLQKQMKSFNRCITQNNTNQGQSYLVS